MKATLLITTLSLAIAVTTQAAPRDPSAGAYRAAEGTASAYTVKSGDTLSKIAHRSGCTAKALASANGLTLKSTIQVGQRLRLPAASGQSTPQTQNSPGKTSRSGSYTVCSGDTLYKIARSHGVSVNQIQAANPGIKPTSMRPGQTLRIPGDSTSNEIASTSPAPKRETEQSANLTPAQNTSAPEPMLGAKQSYETLAPARKAKSVMIDREITYGDFAAKHGTDTERLNDLNGLDLNMVTVLAKGSELYVPAQP